MITVNYISTNRKNEEVKQSIEIECDFLNTTDDEIFETFYEKLKYQQLLNLESFTIKNKTYDIMDDKETLHYLIWYIHITKQRLSSIEMDVLDIYKDLIKCRKDLEDFKINNLTKENSS